MTKIFRDFKKKGAIFGQRKGFNLKKRKLISIFRQFSEKFLKELEVIHRFKKSY